MGKTYYLPGGDNAFRDWSDRFTGNLLPSLERFGFPPATYELIVALKKTFTDALAAANNPMTRTGGTISAKNDARKLLEVQIRQAVRRYLIPNPDVTNKDREDLGLPVYKTSHTPVPTPTTMVKTKVTWPAPAVVEIAFRDSEIEGRSKPFGVHGAEILYGILPEPPTRWDELTHSVFDTRSPIRLSFENDDRRKILYFAARWESTRGEKGPWSPIESTTIP
jgi:hypothetical protein